MLNFSGFACSGTWTYHAVLTWTDLTSTSFYRVIMATFQTSNTSPFAGIYTSGSNPGVAGNFLGAYTSQAGPAVSPTISVANKWYVVFATYDLLTVRLYVNGVLVASAAHSNIVCNENGMYLGVTYTPSGVLTQAYGGPMHFLQAAIWPTALTAGEISARASAISVTYNFDL